MARTGTAVVALGKVEVVVRGVNENGVVFTLADEVVLVEDTAGLEPPVNANKEGVLDLAVDEVTAETVGC